MRLWRSLNLARFFLGEGPEHGPITLNRRRVYILPTRNGLIFALVLFAMLLGAVNYNNSLVYVLTFMLASMVVVSILHTFRNLNRLRFRAGLCRPVFAGEAARFPVCVENPEGPNRLGVDLRFPDASGVQVDVLAEDSHWVSLPQTSSQRGLMAMGRFVVSTRYPLGLFRAWAHLDLDTHCLIYPKPAAETGLPRSDLHGEESGGDQGQGTDDFAELRPYRAGDPLKHVYWKTLAREQDPVTKQFGGERIDQLWLSWEALGNMGVEQRLSRLCRWILEADDATIPYGLILPGTRIPPTSGDAHRERCLKALALYGSKP